MFWAKRTKIPVIGSIIRWVANLYGRNVENGYILSTDEACQIVDISKIIVIKQMNGQINGLKKLMVVGLNIVNIVEQRK